MTSIIDLIDDVNDQLSRLVDALPHVHADCLDLDLRCGKVYVDVEHRVIVVNNSNRRQLEYYGGFEYIKPECVTTMGDYTIYNGEDSRVEEALDYYSQRN